MHGEGEPVPGFPRISGLDSGGCVGIHLNDEGSNTQTIANISRGITGC